MEMNNHSNRSWEELYDECCDLRLPVSQKDSKETLEKYIIAVGDESAIDDDSYIDKDLEEDPVYIGKYSRLKVIINKILPF
jgi:3-methyladenine DNA glycosylase AlkC